MYSTRSNSRAAFNHWYVICCCFLHLLCVRACVCSITLWWIFWCRSVLKLLMLKVRKINSSSCLSHWDFKDLSTLFNLLYGTLWTFQWWAGEGNTNWSNTTPQIVSFRPISADMSARLQLKNLDRLARDFIGQVNKVKWRISWSFLISDQSVRRLRISNVACLIWYERLLFLKTFPRGKGFGAVMS